MGLLRIIWKDILWLNSLTPAVKIAVLIVAIALILGAWYLGAEWWTTPVLFFEYKPPTPPLEIAAVILAITFICYLSWVIDRYRKTR